MAAVSLRSVDGGLEDGEDDDLSPVIVVHSDMLKEKIYYEKGIDSLNLLKIWEKFILVVKFGNLDHVEPSEDAAS